MVSSPAKQDRCYPGVIQPFVVLRSSPHERARDTSEMNGIELFSGDEIIDELVGLSEPDGTIR
jgi:hypothetical protein